MPSPRLCRPAVVALVLAAALTGCAGADGTPIGDRASTPGPSGQHRLPSGEAMSGALPDDRASWAVPRPAASQGPAVRSTPGTVPVLDQPVIVDLAVRWRPESELTQDEAAAQRARVRRAENEVLRALGPHGRLRRQLHETAQTALLVDAEGLALLRRHPRVAKVQEDRARPADAG